MIRKVSLVAALFLMLILGMMLGEMLAQYGNQEGDLNQAGNFGAISNNRATTDKSFGFDSLWDDDLYMMLTNLQREVGSSNQQRGVRDPGRRGGVDPQRRRTSWAEMIDTEELLAFLREHEPRMASQLERLKDSNEEMFNTQAAAYKEIYGPVMQQIKRDPEAGKLSIEKIRINLYIKWTLFQVKRSEKGTDRYHSSMSRLKDHVAEEFEVIVKQQQAQVKRMEERIKDHAENTQEVALQGDRGRSGQRQRGFDPEELRKEIGRRKQAIESWKTNKDKIVQERVAELLQDHPAFPWGD